MNMAILTIFIFVMTFQGLLSRHEDFYWRDYTGTIPSDAIGGGRDINRNVIYIGQAFVKDKGLIVSEIFPEERGVCAPIFGAKKIDSYIKILCGHAQNARWFPANATHLLTQILEKKPVIGGHETGGILYVGRFSLGGGTKIGKITPFNHGDALLHYCHRGEEKRAKSYEILLYS